MQQTQSCLLKFGLEHACRHPRSTVCDKSLCRIQYCSRISLTAKHGLQHYVGQSNLLLVIPAHTRTAVTVKLEDSKRLSAYTERRAVKELYDELSGAYGLPREPRNHFTLRVTHHSLEFDVRNSVKNSVLINKKRLQDSPISGFYLFVSWWSLRSLQLVAHVNRRVEFAQRA